MIVAYSSRPRVSSQYRLFTRSCTVHTTSISWSVKPTCLNIRRSVVDVGSSPAAPTATVGLGGE